MEALQRQQDGAMLQQEVLEAPGQVVQRLLNADNMQQPGAPASPMPHHLGDHIESDAARDKL